MAPNPRTFFDIELDAKPLGRVVFELFADRVPRTVENFRVLCTGAAGISPVSGVPLCYEGSLFHRVIRMCSASSLVNLDCGLTACAIDRSPIHASRR